MNMRSLFLFLFALSPPFASATSPLPPHQHCMADNLYRVAAASPELANLLRRLKTIFAITGGEVPKEKGSKQDAFNEKKSMLIHALQNFDKLVESRDHSNLSKDSRDYIRLKLTINGELAKLEGLVQSLAETHKAEVKAKGSKMTGQELATRKEVLESVVGEFHHAYKLAKGHTHASAEENLGGTAGNKVLGMDELKKGTFSGAGIKTRKEELTGEQRQMLQEIQGVTKEQDKVLDEIGGVMDELKNLAENMQDELQKQNKMLNDLEEKTDNVQGKLDKVNDR
jgi:hypothetical protein